MRNALIPFITALALSSSATAQQAADTVAPEAESTTIAAFAGLSDRATAALAQKDAAQR